MDMIFINNGSRLCQIIQYYQGEITKANGKMIKQFDHLYKAVIIGNSGVGKSSILIRFAENQFQEHYLATIGVDFRFKTTTVDNKNVKFQIWDTAGQERFRTITSAYYRGSQAVLMVFDLTDQQSFADVCKFWMGEVEQYAEKDAMFILVGNKSDLLDSRRVSEQQISAFCKEKKMPFVQCSAKEDEKVKDIFNQIARTLMMKEQMKITSATANMKKGKALNEKKGGDVKKKCC